MEESIAPLSLCLLLPMEQRITTQLDSTSAANYSSPAYTQDITINLHSGPENMLGKTMLSFSSVQFQVVPSRSFSQPAHWLDTEGVHITIATVGIQRNWKSTADNTFYDGISLTPYFK